MFFATLRKNMRWIIIVIVAAFALGGTLYLGTGAGTQTTSVSQPLAEVNGEIISYADFQQAYANNVRFYSQLFGPIQGQMAEQVMYATLQDLIVNSLVKDAAKTAALPVDKQEIDAELADIKAGFPDDATYRQALTQSGLTEARLRELIREQLSIQKLEQSIRDEVELSEEEIADLDEQSVDALRREAEDRRVQDWLTQLQDDAEIVIYNPQLRAHHLLVQGDLQGAIEEYKVALVTDPTNPYLHMSLGAVYEELGQTEDALAAYEEAARLTETDPMVHVQLGLAYRDAERMDEAAEALRTAGEINPWDAQLQFALLQLFTEMNLLEDAQKAQERIDEMVRLQSELQQTETELDDVEVDASEDAESESVAEKTDASPAEAGDDTP